MYLFYLFYLFIIVFSLSVSFSFLSRIYIVVLCARDCSCNYSYEHVVICIQNMELNSQGITKNVDKLSN